jgi:hypothetical protein
MSWAKWKFGFKLFVHVMYDAVDTGIITNYLGNISEHIVEMVEKLLLNTLMPFHAT